MKKGIIIIGVLSLFLFVGKIYASCINPREENCNYPNCSQVGLHYHYDENNYQRNVQTYPYHCEVDGCTNTNPHTHEMITNSQSSNNTNSCYNCNNYVQNSSHHNYNNNVHHRNHH